MDDDPEGRRSKKIKRDNNESSNSEAKAMVCKLSDLKLECHIKILEYLDSNSLWGGGCSGICHAWWQIIHSHNNNNIIWRTNPHFTQQTSQLMEQLIQYCTADSLVEMFRRHLYWDFNSSNGLVAGYRIGHKPNSPYNLNDSNNVINAEAVRDFSKAGAVVQTILDVLKEGDAMETLADMLDTNDSETVVPFIVKYQQEYIDLTQEDWLKQRSKCIQEMEDNCEDDPEDTLDYEPITNDADGTSESSSSMIATGLPQILPRVLSLSGVRENTWEGPTEYQQFWDEDVQDVPADKPKQAKAMAKARNILEAATTDPMVYCLNMTDSESVELYFWCGRIGYYLAGLMVMSDHDS